MPTITLIPLILAGGLIITATARAEHMSTEQDWAWHIANNPAFNDGTWTLGEKIKWLESQMFESMSGACRYGNGNCPGGKIVGGKCVKGKGGGKTAGGNANSSTGNNTAGIQSQPATDIQGEQKSVTPAVVSVPATGIQGEPAVTPPAVVSVPATSIHGDQPDLSEPDAQSEHRQPGGALSNGKVPEDIPSVNNDDIIARQFRQAALEATNPVEKARLWNEYRRYKNLPAQEVPEG